MNKTHRPTILVTNDDGIFSEGIHCLADIASEFGNVLIVAPDSPQSAQGHAITLEHPLRLHKSALFEGIEAYQCSGTPVDCVKMAKHLLRRGQPVDLCLSGINHGSNASISILYSGTMSAAMEASIEGIPAVGFSLHDFDADNPHFETAKDVVRRVVQLFFEKGFGKATLLNVNIPNLPLEKIKDLRVCRQAEGLWREEFTEGKDPLGRTYYWLTGKFECHETDIESDIVALREGYVSIVPSMHNLTHFEAMESLKMQFS
ncbi:MAG: 5(3)-nucleotidase/polyphosphatase [Bacteroidota bacterium]